MADDAGALLVRLGLVSANALDDARAHVADLGGTVGEQLVAAGAISDDALTEFYRTRLLVPQVNPNMLARLTARVVATVPGDMAVELRAIPVSLDGDNNLTVAMSDPSDRHAVDEIAFFTNAYVVRAVATQMQIAWCLAHYYGHVTTLGQRLLHASEPESPVRAASAASAAAQRVPRTKGLTGKVDAARHRAIAPITGPVDVIRPNSGALDLRPLAAASPAVGVPDAARSRAARVTPGVASAAARPAAHSATPPGSTVPTTQPLSSPPASGPVPRAQPQPAASGPMPRAQAQPSPAASGPMPRAQAQPSPVASGPIARPQTPASGAPALAPPRSTAVAAPPPMGPARPRNVPTSTPAPLPAPPPAGGSSEPAPSPVIAPTASFVPRAAPDAITLPPINNPEPPPPAPSDGAPDKPRARSISGEIRVPSRRAASIKPPLPAEPTDDEEPLIVIEAGSDDDATGPLMLPPPPRRRAVQSDPPELYARAGEVDLKRSADRAIDDEPRIVIDEDALAPPPEPSDRPAHWPVTVIDVLDDAETGAVIHDRIIERGASPLPLDVSRTMTDQIRAVAAATLATIRERIGEEDDDTSEVDIVVLDARKPKPTRPERRTQHGVPPAPIAVRARDTAASGVPTQIGDVDHTQPTGDPVDRTRPTGATELDRARRTGDAKALDLPPAPPGDATHSDHLAAPPAPSRADDTNPHILAPPPPPRRSAQIQRAVLVDDEAPVAGRRIDYDPVDDGWGPPGTTIPPPLLGAIPGSEDDDEDDDDDDDGNALNIIPMPSIGSSPLVVGLPSRPSGSEASARTLVRALEDATARAIEVIRRLERSETRDDVVDVMVAHLAETHHRAGFFVTRQGTAKGSVELGLFSMTPRPPVMPFANLRLDRPSTLQDVVGTRLPYRGPMHDDASRSFLVSILGACPPEILLVPVAVRERVVGVLFGEHRQRQTFDDQLALAARAAGMALERILKAKRT